MDQNFKPTMPIKSNRQLKDQNDYREEGAIDSPRKEYRDSTYATERRTDMKSNRDKLIKMDGRRDEHPPRREDYQPKRLKGDRYEYSNSRSPRGSNYERHPHSQRSRK